MKRKYIAIILICVLLAAALFVGLSPQKDESPWKENTAGEAIGVELGEIDYILVSTEVYYLDDHDSALWTTVTDADKIEKIYFAISNQKLKDGYPGDDGIAGGGPRFVTYVLKDGSEILIRFIDDQQFWLEDGSVFWFKKPFQLYNEIDEILTDYVYSPASADGTEETEYQTDNDDTPKVSFVTADVKYSGITFELPSTDSELLESILLSHALNPTDCFPESVAMYTIQINNTKYSISGSPHDTMVRVKSNNGIYIFHLTPDENTQIINVIQKSILAVPADNT